MAEILLIDDDADMHKIVSFFLENIGHRVVCVPSGTQGLQHAAQNRVDLILLDVSMPRMDGIETYVQFQETFASKAPPIIFLTVHDEYNLPMDLIESGCAGFIKKPVSSERLQESVNAVLMERPPTDRTKKAET